MLQKSKSKQVHLFKYALLIPLVFGMLIYTSAEAQENTLFNNSEDQELTDKEIKTKLMGEYIKLKESGADFQLIYNTFFTKSKKYILSKEEYYRQSIYFEYILGDAKKDLLKSSMIDRNYEDYIEWKKTDKAKETWENSTYNGVLKLVVDDIKNLKTIEEDKKKQKMDLLQRDAFYTKLIMTDGESTVTIATTDTKKETTKNEKLLVDVPFAKVEQVPVFPGCESLETNEAKKECMARSISKHVNRNFNTDLATELGLKGRQRINVIFKIDTKGNIASVNSRAPHPDLEAEAIRVIKTLPKMIPGKHKGGIVSVPYSLPIIFQVHDQSSSNKAVDVPHVDSKNENISEADIEVEEKVNSEENDDINKIEQQELTEVPYAVVDQAPVYVGCESISDKEEQKKCSSNEIAKYVNLNFDTKLATALGLKGRQLINVVFKIDNQGNVTVVRSRAPHPDLEQEAIRVIKSIPQLIPGEHKGNKVDVLFSLPIIFQVADNKKND